jgi:hypothetical protein
MREIEAELDWDVPPGSPQGSFKVIGLTDDAGEDLRPLIQPSPQFASLDALRDHLFKALGEEIVLIEASSAR